MNNKKIIIPNKNINSAMAKLQQEQKFKEVLNNTRVISAKFGILITRVLYNIFLLNETKQLDLEIIKDINTKIQKITTDEEFLNISNVNELIDFVKDKYPEININEDDLISIMPYIEGLLNKKEDKEESSN